MPFERDEALIAALRRVADNAAVLDELESASAHGDLGAVLFRFARQMGVLRVVPLSTSTFPALVATRVGDDRIVAAASGMRWLLVRTERVPEPAHLRHEPAPHLGPAWWKVAPFDAGAGRTETAEELARWLTAAAGRARR